ncbi:MAG: NAD-dependent protein deacylase [Alphaproteobacteria bacterium]|nr:MAG: NAD-dependent protein deacylase [Alphaproteobacteria bacterium]
MTLYQNIIILTGAGISAESGLATFRNKGGIWKKYDLMKLATPEAFASNPDLVHEFYNARRSGLKKVNPNAAHYALARLDEKYPGNITLITQNVDPLHERAGSRNLLHMHGELNKARCVSCHSICPWFNDLFSQSICPGCGKAGNMRPHIVWFGEIPFHIEQINIRLAQCDLFISIGTSGNVYPAAGFVQAAQDFGAETVELNLEPTDSRNLFSVAHYGKATEIVPEYVADLIRQE